VGEQRGKGEAESREGEDQQGNVGGGGAPDRTEQAEQQDRPTKQEGIGRHGGVRCLLPATFVVLCRDGATKWDRRWRAKTGDRTRPRLGPLHFRRIDGAHGPLFALCAFEDAARGPAGWEPLLGAAGLRNLDEMIS